MLRLVTAAIVTGLFAVAAQSMPWRGAPPADAFSVEISLTAGAGACAIWAGP